MKTPQIRKKAPRVEQLNPDMNTITTPPPLHLKQYPSYMSYVFSICIAFK